jgi:ABC-type polar amino acid transport system ATPase subunit
MIRVENLTKSFGSLAVLQGLSLSIERGETLAIIGPSGSGKSTFIRCLNLLEKPDSGRLDVDGVVIEPPRFPSALVQAVRRQVGMVFQSFNLFPHFTALQNVAEGLVSVKKKPKAEALALAGQYLDKVGLGDKLSSYPAHLSGGQQQRVAIARTLAMEPKIVLMDEPTSALDPELVQEVLAVIRALVKAHTITIVIVTHELNFAREISDRAIFMDKGLIVEEGPPARLFSQPEKERTRAFLARYLGDGDYAI